MSHVRVCVCVCVCGDGAINLVLQDEWGGGGNCNPLSGEVGVVYVMSRGAL